MHFLGVKFRTVALSENDVGAMGLAKITHDFANDPLTQGENLFENMCTRPVIQSDIYIGTSPCQDYSSAGLSSGPFNMMTLLKHVRLPNSIIGFPISISINSGRIKRKQWISVVRASRKGSWKCHGPDPQIFQHNRSRFLQIISSEAFLLENVTGLPTRHQKDFNAAVQLFGDAGYVGFSDCTCAVSL